MKKNCSTIFIIIISLLFHSCESSDLPEDSWLDRIQVDNGTNRVKAIYEYPDTIPFVEFEYNELDQLIKAKYESGSNEYHYLPDGRLSKLIYSTQHAVDSLEYDGHNITIKLSAAGLIVKIDNSQENSQILEVGQLVPVDYDSLGNTVYEFERHEQSVYTILNGNVIKKETNIFSGGDGLISSSYSLIYEYDQKVNPLHQPTFPIAIQKTYYFGYNNLVKTITLEGEEPIDYEYNSRHLPFKRIGLEETWIYQYY